MPGRQILLTDPQRSTKNKGKQLPGKTVKGLSPPEKKKEEEKKKEGKQESEIGLFLCVMTTKLQQNGRGFFPSQKKEKKKKKKVAKNFIKGLGKSEQLSMRKAGRLSFYCVLSHYFLCLAAEGVHPGLFQGRLSSRPKCLIAQNFRISSKV